MGKSRRQKAEKESDEQKAARKSAHKQKQMVESVNKICQNMKNAALERVLAGNVGTTASTMETSEVGTSSSYSTEEKLRNELEMVPLNKLKDSLKLAMKICNVFTSLSLTSTLEADNVGTSSTFSAVDKGKNKLENEDLKSGTSSSVNSEDADEALLQFGIADSLKNDLKIDEVDFNEENCRDEQSLEKDDLKMDEVDFNELVCNSAAKIVESDVEKSPDCAEMKPDGQASIAMQEGTAVNQLQDQLDENVDENLGSLLSFSSKEAEVKQFQTAGQQVNEVESLRVDENVKEMFKLEIAAILPFVDESVYTAVCKVLKEKENEVKKELNTLLVEKKYEELFVYAVGSKLVWVLLWVFENVDILSLVKHTPPLLSQGVLLSILLPLANDITLQKLDWMSVIINALHTFDETVQQLAGPVIRESRNILDKHVPTTQEENLYKCGIMNHIDSRFFFYF